MAATTEEAERAFLETAPNDAARVYDRFAIADGRWRRTEVPKVTGPFAQRFRSAHSTAMATPSNPYGFLRSPWNANPSPFVTRFARRDATLPDCESHWRFATRVPPEGERGAPAHFQVADVRAGDLGWWMRNVAFLPHGRFHDATGGTARVGFRDVERAMAAAFGVDEVRFKESMTLKSLWRYRMVDMPEACGAATPPRNCSLRCVATFEGIGRLVAALQGPREAFFDPSKRQREGGPEDAAAMAKIGAALCEAPPAFAKGDQFEASGGRDPSFWPVHPTIERLYQYAQLLRPFTNETWPATNVCSSGDEPLPRRSDAVGASRYTAAARGAPCFAPGAAPDPQLANPRDCCYGHHADDKWYEAYPAERGGASNARMLALLDPRRRPRPEDDFGVVYHHFRWPHCARRGARGTFAFAPISHL